MFSGLGRSWEVFRDNIHPGRLLEEEDGVIGCCVFSKRREDIYHTIANFLRVLFCIIAAPLYVLVPRAATNLVYNIFHDSWDIETAAVPDAALTTSPGDQGSGKYEGSVFRPRWMLKLKISRGLYHSYEQVPWSEDVRDKGYVALSYAMESAVVLAKQALPQDAPNPRMVENLSRKEIAQYLLIEYAYARGRGNAQHQSEEFVWLDEFCLTEEVPMDMDNRRALRSEELGKMAEIYRGAKSVCVFCHVINCDHTSTTCIWGSRIFTLSEILHANKVLRMTRRHDGRGNIRSDIRSDLGQSFRACIQAAAAKEERWHLYAIMQHSVNSGSVPWQAAIHSLIVEIIRRDEEGKFYEHTHLGKALNGLLPRRSRLQDLRGKDGWADLAWLLELNQGFFNTASLAAICNLNIKDPRATDASSHRSDTKTETSSGSSQIQESRLYSWLGPPIPQKEGSERLEPLATAFPVTVAVASQSQPALCIIGARAIGLHHALKRDAGGLKNNEIMKPLRRFIILIFWLFFAAFCGVASRNIRAGLALMYIDCVAYAVFLLLGSTIFVVRDGWIYLRDADWQRQGWDRLGDQDPNLRTLTHWGDRQLAPKWRIPANVDGHQPSGGSARYETGRLVDLRYRVSANIIATGKPNCFVPIAIHGSGITGMLLTRPSDPLQLSRRVAMANVPSYVLSAAEATSTVYVE